MNHFKLIVDQYTSRMLYIHRNLAHHLALEHNQKVFLCFGIREFAVQIKISEYLKTEEIAVSQNVVRYLSIPVFAKYEFRKIDNRLLIGPYISFLATYKIKSLMPYINRTIHDYVTHYSEIGGAILVFATEGINSEAKTVKGYVYNPESKEWIYGIYPYPSSIFIRGHVNNEKWCTHFQSILGKFAVFNDFYFDKWQMYQFLMNHHFGEFLPKTELYRTPEDVLRLMSNHPSVYLKPIHGTMGISIAKAERFGSSIHFRYRDGTENKKIICKTVLQTKKTIRNKLDSNRYIIQQALPLITNNNRMIDFRLIVVKNTQGNWEYMGMVARYGAKKSFISNISAGGTAEKGEVALKNTLSLTDAALLNLTNQMKQLALSIAQSFDQYGLHCGNLGIDIGVDHNQKLWIIEVQHYSPAHNIAVDANDLEMYTNILRNNLLYMKRIAHFEGGENG